MGSDWSLVLTDFNELLAIVVQKERRLGQSKRRCSIISIFPQCGRFSM